jgi:hypothetical protein
MPRGIPGSGVSRMGKVPNLDDNIIRQFCALGQLGLGKTQICAKLYIPVRTCVDWFVKGQKHLNRKKNSKAIPNGEIYAQLVTEWKRACAIAEENLIRNIQAAAARQWQANAWMLERKWPERWADRGAMLKALDKEFAKLVESLRKQAAGGTGEVPPVDPGS